MDDLFGDVDRILEGDLGDLTTTAEKQTAVPQPTQTVQLSADFLPRSAADNHQVTIATERSTSADRPSYRTGGRPVTDGEFGRSPAGNLQSSVIQSPIYSSSSHPSGHSSGQDTSAATIEVEPPPTQGVSNHLYPPSADPDFSFTDDSPRPLQTIFKPKRRIFLPFLMMGAASVAVISTLGLWYVGTVAGSNWMPINTEAAAAELPADSDADFLAYLQKSLGTISAGQLAGNQSVAAIPVAAPAVLPTAVPNANPVSATGALPNLPTLPNLSAPAADSPNIIERVFVPVYQNSQSQNSPVANSTPDKAKAALPPIALSAANNSRRRPTVPVPEPVAAAALPPSAPATGISSIPVVPGDSNRSLPSPDVDLAVGSSAGSPAALNDVTPSSELVLVGVLNLGNRSAALFDIDGSSQRAYVGDRIGLSSWNLVSVNGQDVVIRRNDEVRSVYIGQRF